MVRNNNNQDQSLDPYYVHSSDNSTTVTVTPQLNGENYHSWSMKMRRALAMKNKFKFVLAGVHNVCRAKNATRNNGVFGQLGEPLCIKPLSPTDALQLISRPLRYLGF